MRKYRNFMQKVLEIAHRKILPGSGYTAFAQYNEGDGRVYFGLCRHPIEFGHSHPWKEEDTHEVMGSVDLPKGLKEYAESETVLNHLAELL